MTGNRGGIGFGLFAAALLGAGAGGSAAWLLRTSPSDLTVEHEQIAALETEMETSRRAIERLELEFAAERAASRVLRSRLEGELSRADRAPMAPRPSNSDLRSKPTLPRLDRASAKAAAEELLTRLFGEVIIGDSLAAIGPPGARFVGIAQTFHPTGVEFLASRLESPELKVRLAAIRLAGRLGGGDLVEPLARVARSDRSDLLRIFAAEALASLPSPDATESWLSLIGAEEIGRASCRERV